MVQTATAPGAVQPSFDELGTPLSDVTFCVVDLETTGSTDADSITEFGAVKVRGGELLGEFQTLVNPRSEIPALIAVLTGITNRMVADAPRLGQVLPAFLAFADGCVLVAHNARFDHGFLRRACAELDYPVPRWLVLDTAAMARQILLADEVPNCRLATLARHFHSPTTPNHRALTDAQATVDVLHALIERVGNLGVRTIEDLREFTRKVSPGRRAKRSWASELPESPGVYLFVAEHDEHREVLYVGKSVNIRRRVRTYFTAAESRRRMDEMVRVSTGVEAVECATPLQAEVCELRLIATHAPRYNRRSKYPERQHWIKITTEPFPRLSLVRTVRDDQASYFGPFRQRQSATDAMLALYDGFPIRQCATRIPLAQTSPTCALAELGRCSSPCNGAISRDDYGRIVDQVRTALSDDVRPAVAALQHRLRRLVSQQRYEEAATVRNRLATLTRTGRRYHRVGSIAGCRQIVAARRVDAADPTRSGWEIHVIRYGRLAGAALARPQDVPQAVARACVTTADSVRPPVGPLGSAGIEETERIADWLEQPGVRIIEIDGDWFWPLHGVITDERLPALLDLSAEPEPASHPL